MVVLAQDPDGVYYIKALASGLSPLQDEHLLTVLGYIERNPVRAELVERAQDWRWSSAAAARVGGPALDPGPVALPRNWQEYVNEAQTEAEVERLCRGRPVRGERLDGENSSTVRPRSVGDGPFVGFQAAIKF